MSNEQAAALLPADRVIVSSRVLNALRERVFLAWTTPEYLARWWGPKGFRNTFEVCEVRPGGAWRFTMHGPDGKSYPNKSVFVAVEPPALIIIQHISPPQFQMTVSFEELGAQTRLSWQMLFESAETCAHVKTYAVEANEQNFDRLEELLATLPVAAPGKRR